MAMREDEKISFADGVVIVALLAVVAVMGIVVGRLAMRLDQLGVEVSATDAGAKR